MNGSKTGIRQLRRRCCRGSREYNGVPFAPAPSGALNPRMPAPQPACRYLKHHRSVAAGSWQLAAGSPQRHRRRGQRLGGFQPLDTALKVLLTFDGRRHRPSFSDDSYYACLRRAWAPTWTTNMAGRRPLRSCSDLCPTRTTLSHPPHHPDPRYHSCSL